MSSASPFKLDKIPSFNTAVTLFCEGSVNWSFQAVIVDDDNDDDNDDSAELRNFLIILECQYWDYDSFFLTCSVLSNSTSILILTL